MVKVNLGAKWSFCPYSYSRGLKMTRHNENKKKRKELGFWKGEEGESQESWFTVEYNGSSS